MVNLDFRVHGANFVLVLADGTEVVVLGGPANRPTFVIRDVELPQVALFATLEDSNINVEASPDGSFYAQGAPDGTRNFEDNQIGDGFEEFALADLLGDTSFDDEFRTAQIFGGNGRPSISNPLTTSFIYGEAVIARGDGVKVISGVCPSRSSAALPRAIFRSRAPHRGEFRADAAGPERTKADGQHRLSL